MKKWIVLSIGSLAFAGLIFFLYQNGQSALAAHHREVIQLLAHSRNVESGIEQDVLKSRGFMVADYDRIVELTLEMETLCSRLKNEMAGAGSQNLLNRYCSELEAKGSQVEQFKSKNAIYRNSLYFLHGLATEGAPKAHEGLLGAVLAYAALSTDKAKGELANQLEVAEARNADLLLAIHTRKILDLKGLLDQLTDSILNGPSAKTRDELAASYLATYASAENEAQSYRIWMTTVCTFFLLTITFAIFRLWRGAQLLEHRVEERTRELKSSNQTVVDQQKALLLSARRSALGEMAGQIAHEINTPLGALVLTAQGVKKKAQDAEVPAQELTTKMDFILQVTNKMARIVSSMRKLAGNDSNETIAEIDIKTLLDDALLLCEGRFKKAGIGFSLRNGLDEKATVQCRANQIGQVLINLLNNAHDAVKDKSEKAIELEIVSTDKMLVFRIADNGSGVDPSNVPKLFSPQFSTKSLDQGTGFGLSICKKIIEGHGGRIFLDVNAPQTTFVFEIPLDQSESIATAVAS